MSIKLSIGSKEVKAEKVVKPGWYATKINDPKEELAKDKESINYTLEATGQEGDATNVPTKCFFSEKFIQNINPLVRATGPLQGIPNPLSEDTGIDPRYDFEKINGNIVFAQWKTDRGKDGQEKAKNVIVDWAPLPKDHPLAVKGAGESAAPVSAGGFE